MKIRELSFWERKHLFPDQDIIIVGGGIVGLTTARLLKERFPSNNICLLEKNPVGSLASSKNAGFSCFGSVSEIAADIKSLGEPKVADLIRLRREGLQDLEKRYGSKNIQLEYCGGYELFHEHDNFEKYASLIPSINQMIREQIFQTVKTPGKLHFYNRSILNPFEGHLNTGLLYKNLIQDCKNAGVQIIKGVEVLSFEEAASYVRLITSVGDIKCERLVLTTNALTKALLPDLPVEGTRNQVIVTSEIPNHGISGTFHIDKGYIYFRDVGDRILIGGGRHLFEKERTDQLGANMENRNFLIQLLRERILPYHQDFNIEHAWSGIIASGPVKIPIVEKYSERITIGVRLGGMGVAIGMKIGQDTATLAVM